MISKPDEDFLDNNQTIPPPTHLPPGQDDSSSVRSRGKRPAIREPAVCTNCGVAFMALKYVPRTSDNRFCSRKCCAAHAAATGKFAGDKNPRWLGGVSHNNMRYRRRQKDRWPERESARRAVRLAIRAGTLVREPCEKCGASKVHGHHDDYAKPLGVRWLCRTHHDEHHRIAGDKVNGGGPILDGGVRIFLHERREDAGSEVLDGAADVNERGGSRG
jgi:hypothetical protein